MVDVICVNCGHTGANHRGARGQCQAPIGDNSTCICPYIVEPSIEPKCSAECCPNSHKPEAVNHPPHYNQHPSGIECQIITRHFNFNLGNAIKYIWRADLKGDAIQDLEKAVWYLNDELQKRKAGK